MFTYIVCYTHHCNGRVEGPLWPSPRWLPCTIPPTAWSGLQDDENGIFGLHCAWGRPNWPHKEMFLARHFLDFLGYLGSLVVLAWHIFFGNRRDVDESYGFQVPVQYGSLSIPRNGEHGSWAVQEVAHVAWSGGMFDHRWAECRGWGHAEGRGMLNHPSKLRTPTEILKT